MAINSLGRFIRDCRESLGFTSRKVEELTKSRPGLAPISHSNLLAIEKGNHVPTYDKILTLSLVFNIPTLHFEDRLKQDMLGEPSSSNGQSFTALMQAGTLALDEGHNDRALELFTQAYAKATAESQENPTLEASSRVAEARLQAANCRRRLGLLRIAKEDLEELLGNDVVRPSIALRASFLLAEVSRELKNFRLALLHARAALELATSVEDERLRGKILNTVANILDDRGETAAAIVHYTEAIQLFERLGDRRATGLIARNLGTAHARLQQFDLAQRYILEGLTVARETSDRRGLAYGFSNLARVYYLKGETQKSKEYARQAKQIAQRESYPDVLFVSLFYLWKASLREAQPSLTRVYAERLGVLQRKLETRCVELEEWISHSASSRRIRA